MRLRPGLCTALCLSEVHADKRRSKEQRLLRFLPLPYRSFLQKCPAFPLKRNRPADPPVQLTRSTDRILHRKPKYIEQTDQAGHRKCSAQGQKGPSGQQPGRIGRFGRHLRLLYDLKRRIGKYISGHLLIVLQGRIDKQVCLPRIRTGSAEHQQIRLLDGRTGDRPLDLLSHILNDPVPECFALEHLSEHISHRRRHRKRRVSTGLPAYSHHQSSRRRVSRFICNIVESCGSEPYGCRRHQDHPGIAEQIHAQTPPADLIQSE